MTPHVRTTTHYVLVQAVGVTWDPGVLTADAVFHAALADRHPADDIRRYRERARTIADRARDAEISDSQVRAPRRDLVDVLVATRGERVVATVPRRVYVISSSDDDVGSPPQVFDTAAGAIEHLDDSIGQGSEHGTITDAGGTPQSWCAEGLRQWTWDVGGTTVLLTEVEVLS